MDEELPKVTNELCDLLRPVNIKLEKWIVENKKKGLLHLTENRQSSGC